MPTVIIKTLRPLSKDGTRLPVGGRTYHFTPNRRGDYVAEVVDVDVETVLSISKGYEVYDDQADAPLPGHNIVTPPEVREAAARAIPAPPRPRGQEAPLGRMKRDTQATDAE
jgi:hypothetical protein